MDAKNEDRILLSTRLVAVGVVPILVLAWIILYFFPQLSGERFAWAIHPPMTAVYMGAGYLGGAWLFANAAFGRAWHRVAPGYPPVAVFTIAMLLASILHWERFDPGHFPFQLWLGLYALTPLLIPLLWWRNQKTAGRSAASRGPAVPKGVRWGLGLMGGLLLLFAAASFARPEWLAGIWVWPLTPLTARIVSGWIALLGAGGLSISGQRSWSAWKTGLESIALWHALVLAGAFVHRQDFTAGLANWYLATVLLLLIGLGGLYTYMGSRRADRLAAGHGPRVAG